MAAFTDASVSVFDNEIELAARLVAPVGKPGSRARVADSLE